MNVSMMSQSLKDRLASSVNIKTGDTVQYVDVNDLSQFVPMPDWFKEITTLPGVPFKFVTEFAGKPDSGKTTAGMVALIGAQKAGIVAILVDAERKFAHKRFKEMGGDPDSLYIIQEPSIEQSFDQLEKTLKIVHEEMPDARILVVYDSIAVGVTKAELEKEATDPQTIADQAKVLKRMIRRIIYYIQECNTALIMINQLYKDVNPMAHGGSKMSGGQGVEYGKALSVSFSKSKELTKTVAGVLYKTGIVTSLESKKNHLLSGDMAVKKLDVEVVAYDMRKAVAKVKKGKGKELDDLPAELDDDSAED